MREPMMATAGATFTLVAGAEVLSRNDASRQAVPGGLAALTATSAELAAARSRAPVRGGLPPRMLRRVQQYIETHLTESISIQALAEIAGLSMYHFARAFKQSAGVTPHEYLVKSRVRRAQELLADTDMPLSQIAIATGFSDQSHCARRFREYFGVTPSGYRWSVR
jgi:transcriptional regulator GlxA family with amidase domain